MPALRFLKHLEFSIRAVKILLHLNSVAPNLKMKKILLVYLFIVCFSPFVSAHVPLKILVQISRAEDELRYDKFLEDLMKNADTHIRTRAALAAGRIGDEAAIPALANLLENDREENVRVMAAFALGETELIKAADAILGVLNNSKSNPNIRARAIEAAGKIASANAKDEKAKNLGEAILATLDFEDRKRSGPFLNVIEFGLTAVLRSRPETAEKVLVKFTRAYTPQIRANALNALARLRAKNAGKQSRELLQNDENAAVRANAARVLGAAEDKDSFDLLLNSAVSDEDSRVRVSAIRALGNLKDKQAADKLLERGEKLLTDYKNSKFANPSEKSEILEIETVLGNLLKDSGNKKAIGFLTAFGLKDNFISPEIHIAFAKISPSNFSEIEPPNNICSQGYSTLCWQFQSSFAQGQSELGNLEKGNEIRSKTESDLIKVLDSNKKSEFAMDFDLRPVPERLRALNNFKPKNSDQIFKNFLGYKDVFVRATAAELLSEQTATKENIEALKSAFAASLKTDKNYNDAQLAILSALAKLDKAQSFESLRLALNAPDYLVRKHAANLIKQNDLTKDFSNIEKMVGTVKPYNPKTGTKLGQILNSEADYIRAVSRKNGTVKAVFTTEKGTFAVDLTPEDAPLTVDNFIKLARLNYFNGVPVHRVVPNFVMQDGDPRGDGNGGPGWEIRCEINMLPFERGAIGMALSGKDTGGSQWFAAHSPQPHLDGGYTVFSKVNETDMKIVDNLTRGDKILTVKIVEGNTAPKVVKNRKK